MRLTAFARDFLLRFDAKAINHFSRLDAITDETIPLHAIAEVSQMTPCERPTEPFSYHEISTVDEFGLGEPYCIDDANIEQGSDEERVLAKVDKGDIARPRANTILLPKVRPSLGKFVYVMESDSGYYTTAFLEVRPKTISCELLYCILKHPTVLGQISRVSRIGKGYPTISGFDLTRFVRVPATILSVDSAVEATVAGGLHTLFDDLSRLRHEREIIDAVLEDQLACRVPPRVAPKKSFTRSQSEIVMSAHLRMSAHFMEPEFSELMKSIWQGDTAKIGRLCALPISLGVSPEPCLDESDHYYLGPQAMMSERLDPERLGVVSEPFYNAMEPRFGAKAGDVFLRRSGASLGKVLYFDSHLPCIFSDFMMRLRFHDQMVGRYASYWMRSTLFQYLLKAMAVVGKGLQNVYPSQVGLMPIPSPEKYNLKEIVETIDDEISKNEDLRLEVREGLAALQDRLSRVLGFAQFE
jgi:hypothetical protein